MRVSRRRGRVQLRLDPAETAVLDGLLAELDALLAGDPRRPDPDDAEVVRRLYPSAYPDDERASAEFRELTETALRDERRERLAECRTDLAAGNEVVMDDEAGARWLRVLNDLRLTLGTRLGVSEEHDGSELDPTDPASRPWMLYHWLTAVQDSLVRGLSR